MSNTPGSECVQQGATRDRRDGNEQHIWMMHMPYKSPPPHSNCMQGDQIWGPACKPWQLY